MMRMPAFGTSGVWANRPGFAQTMEQMTGLSWVTGHVSDQPRIPRGPCDPNGAYHAAFAALLALLKRHFRTVMHAKPPASRKGSSEWYVIAQGFKGRA